MSRPRRSAETWLAGKLGRPFQGARVLPDTWLAGQVADAVTDALALQKRGVSAVWLHYQRGDVLVSEHQELDGYELAAPGPLPLGLGKAELSEWLLQRLRGVPCCP